MTENIIFDVDGTLWDSAEVVARAWNIVYERRGLTRRFSEKEVSECMGMTLEEIEEKIFSDTPPQEKKEIIDDCLTTQNALLQREGGKLYPMVKETIEELSSNYGIYIVSNCECGYIEALLSQYGNGRVCRGFFMRGHDGTGQGGQPSDAHEKERT